VACAGCATSGTLIRNTEPHQKCSSSSPPSTGPSGRPSIIALPSTDMALPRSASPGNSTRNTEVASGCRNAAAKPSTTRAAISSPGEVENAHHADAAPNSTSAPSSSFLRPNRSPSSPAGISMAATISVYPLENHCRSPMEAFSEVLMVGSATLRIVTSRPTASRARPIAASAHQRAAPPCRVSMVLIVRKFHKFVKQSNEVS
jgi:hypothetical protein